MNKASKTGLLYAIISVMSGALYVAFGNPLFEVITPSSFVFLENAATFVALAAFCGVVPEYRKLKKLKKRQLLGILGYCVFSAMLAPYFFHRGWSLSEPNSVLLLGRTEMLFTVLLAAFVLKEKISAQQIGGIVVMILGIYVIATEAFVNGISFQGGDIFILLGCVFWAIGSIIFKRYSGRVSLELVLLTRAFLGTLFFSFVLLILESEHALFVGSVKAVHIWSFLGYVFIAQLLGRYFFFRSVKKAPLLVWSAVSIASPVLGIFFNYLFLGEIPQPYHYLGGALIIFGFGLVQFQLRKIRLIRNLTEHLRLHGHHVNN